MKQLQATEAKNAFGKLLEDAIVEPVMIQKNGRDFAVVLSLEEFKRHGFVDGDKRVAFACTEIFLDLNEASLVAKEADTIAFIYAHLEAGTFNKDNLDAWLRENVKSG